MGNREEYEAAVASRSKIANRRGVPPTIANANKLFGQRQPISRVAVGQRPALQFGPNVPSLSSPPAASQPFTPTRPKVNKMFDPDSPLGRFATTMDRADEASTRAVLNAITGAKGVGYDDGSNDYVGGSPEAQRAMLSGGLDFVKKGSNWLTSMDAIRRDFGRNDALERAASKNTPQPSPATSAGDFPFQEQPEVNTFDVPAIASPQVPQEPATESDVITTDKGWIKRLGIQGQNSAGESNAAIAQRLSDRYGQEALNSILQEEALAKRGTGPRIIGGFGGSRAKNFWDGVGKIAQAQGNKARDYRDKKQALEERRIDSLIGKNDAETQKALAEIKNLPFKQQIEKLKALSEIKKNDAYASNVESEVAEREALRQGKLDYSKAMTNELIKRAEQYTTPASKALNEKQKTVVNGIMGAMKALRENYVKDASVMTEKDIAAYEQQMAELGEDLKAAMTPPKKAALPAPKKK